eukprot:GILI01031091.1.p2 GENE.GILI01031091.1~~GILI01031091.1.p2  ORF type:complete len:121 (+),score=31.64 GILI01031091.1:477-839(+)
MEGEVGDEEEAEEEETGEALGVCLLNRLVLPSCLVTELAAPEARVKVEEAREPTTWILFLTPVSNEDGVGEEEEEEEGAEEEEGSEEDGVKEEGREEEGREEEGSDGEKDEERQKRQRRL